MNRLILTIMFALALALSFMSLARNDMSWNSNSQNSSASDSENGGWISRMSHFFGSYKPSFGRLAMASTGDDLTPCNSAETCNQIVDPDTQKIMGYSRIVTDPNAKDKNLFKFEFKCEQCDSASHYQVSLPKSVKDLAGINDQLRDQFLAQFKKDTAAKAVAKAVVVAEPQNPEKVAREKKKEQREKLAAQKKIDECKATDVEQVDGKWTATGQVDKEELNDCLRDHYGKFANSSDKHDKATAKALERSLLAAYSKRPTDGSDDEEWNTFIAAHSTTDDNFGIYMSYRDLGFQIAKNYGGYTAGLTDLKNKNYAAAAQDFDSFRQMQSDPSASAQYRTLMTKFQEVRKDYADTVSDDYKPSAEDYKLSSLASSTQTSPSSISTSSLTTLENYAIKQANTQTTGVDAQSILAGINNSGQSAILGLSAISDSSKLGPWDPSRGNLPRGDSWGALASLNPAQDITQLGSTTIAQQRGNALGNNTIANQLSTAGTSSTAGTLNASIFRAGRH